MTLKEMLAWMQQALTYLNWFQRKKNDPALSEPPPPLPLNVPPVKSRETPSLSPTQRLYNAAYASLGKNLSDWAPDELGCANALSRVIQKVYPDFPTLISTIGLDIKLASSQHFKKTKTPTPGTVAVLVTRGNVHGHCWVMGKFHAMSNNSVTGKWDDHYSLQEVYDVAKRRGLVLNFYNPI